MTQSARSQAAVMLCLVAVTLGVFWPVTGFDFTNYDDPEYFTSNKHVLGGLTWDNVAWAFRGGNFRFWHPLTWLSLMLDVSLFGPGSAWPHFVNLLFHVMNAVLLFLLLSRITGALWRSAVVAGLFALHPLHVESVAWVCERKDVLSAFFLFLSLIFYVRYAQFQIANRKSQILNYWLALFFFALGLMSKPMVVTLPFVMLLLDWWPLNRVLNFRTQASSPSERVSSSFRLSTFDSRFFWRLVWEKTPFFMLCVLMCAATFVLHREDDIAMVTLADLTIDARVENALVSYARYLGMTFWPVDLAVFYPHPVHWPRVQVVLATVIVVGLCVATVWQGRRRGYLFVGWYWFLGTLIPVIGLVQVGVQAMADRFTYVPLIGVFIILVWGVGEVLARIGGMRFWMLAVAIAVLCTCAVLTRKQLSYWENAETLFRHALTVTQGNYTAYTNLGYDLFVQGRYREATENYEQALRQAPLEPIAHNNLGTSLHKEHRLDEAIAQFREALRLNPKFIKAHNNLAAALADQGKYAEAIDQYIEVLRIIPAEGRAFVHNKLGSVLRLSGRFDEAIAQFRETLLLEPGNIETHHNLAAMLDAQGRHDEAITQYTKLSRLAPGNAAAEYHLAVLFGLKGQLRDAVAHCRLAIRVRPDYAEAHQQLGVLLARTGDKTNAIAHWQTAIRLKPNWPPALNSLAWLLATDKSAALRDGAAAVTFAESAARATTNNRPEVLDTLAAAYAEDGRWTEAVRIAQTAMDLAASSGKHDLASEIHVRLLQYQAGKPWRE